MTEAEKREHAERLIQTHNNSYDFCEVYEDEELEDADEQDQRDIFRIMHTADLEVSFK